MLVNATHKIVGNANIKRAVRPVSQNVNPSHIDNLQGVDGRDKPGHDEREMNKLSSHMTRHEEPRVEITPKVPIDDYPLGTFAMNEKT